MTTIDRDAYTMAIAERVRTLAAERGVSTATLTSALTSAPDVPVDLAERILAGQEEMTVADFFRLKDALGVEWDALMLSEVED